VKSFIVGAVVGGAVVWVWGPEIREFVDARTVGMRRALATRLQSAADRLQATVDTLQNARQTLESGLGGA
jgi:hypothetical protein